MSGDTYLLLSAQKNRIVLEINPDNLNENQTSLAKNIFSSNKSIIEIEDLDLDLHISKDKFGCKFLNSQKVFSTQYFNPISASQINISQFTSSLSQRMPLVSS